MFCFFHVRDASDVSGRFQGGRRSGNKIYFLPSVYRNKFDIPQITNITSNPVPNKKVRDGIPSRIKLNILPVASPAMHKILERVAGRQYEALKIPQNQKIAIPVYKPIMALKTCFRSTAVGCISKKKGKICAGIPP